MGSDDHEQANRDGVPSRRQKGQTERITLPGEADASPLSHQKTEADALDSDLDPIRSEDIDAMELPDVAYEDLTGEVLGGRYRLDDHLADGGMGSIYRGTHLELEMPIAIKVMLPSMNRLPGYTRRFRREARAMSVVRHRNIVRVLDYGVDAERPYIVMELLEGQPVSDWLNAGEVLPSLREIDELMRQVFDGLAMAHEVGVVHRDLKPDNMYLATEGDGIYMVKLLDFGLAHLQNVQEQGPTLTRSGMVSGTPEYMSPEQCQSLRVGPSTDIYALGCILTELLQREPPFTGETHMLIMSKQMFMEPPPLNRPEDAEPIPPLLERLRRDMLAKDPAQRPATVNEVRQRWLAALRPEVNEQQFPERKRGGGGGARSARVPEWTAPEPAIVTPDPAVSELLRIAVVRLQGGDDGVDDRCVVGLASGGVMAMEWDADDPLAEEAQAVVLDAGTDVDGACAWMASYDAESRPRPVVCVKTKGEDVGKLLAAGAGDLVNYPVDAATVLRKLRKLVRRYRRGRSSSSS